MSVYVVKLYAISISTSPPKIIYPLSHLISRIQSLYIHLGHPEFPFSGAQLFPSQPMKLRSAHLFSRCSHRYLITRKPKMLAIGSVDPAANFPPHGLGQATRHLKANAAKYLYFSTARVFDLPWRQNPDLDITTHCQIQAAGVFRCILWILPFTRIEYQMSR